MVMKPVEDLIWKSSESKRRQQLMLFGIRFIEICMASVIPSFIGLWLVFINPTPRIMSVMSFLSYVAFVVVNWNFWMKFKKQRTRKKEYFVINGIAYTVYAVISLLVFEFTGEFLYSIIFSNLRAFEPFGLHTGYSLVACHTVMYILMIACEIYSRNYYKKLLEKLAENGADEIEMDPWGNLKPMKNDETVEILSVEEMHEEMIKEQTEAVEALQEMEEEEDVPLWEGMYKGRGERILFKDPDDPEYDIDRGDFIAGEDMSEALEDYSADSLWNTDIYRGRTRDGVPVDDYDDEPEDIPDFFEVHDYEGSEDEPLWSADMYKGRDSKDVVAGDETDFDDTPNFSNYDEDTLWSAGMYKGRGEGIEACDEELEDRREWVELPNENSKYDSDSLWDEDFYKAIEERKKREEEEKEKEKGTEKIDAFRSLYDYDPDRLWDDIKQGKQKE